MPETNGSAVKQNQYDLEQNDFFIRKTSKRFLVNSIISMVFLYIGSLIDTLLVGLYLKEDGLAAMSLVSPVYLIYYTVGATIGIGASINASRYLGRGDLTEYRKIFTAATILMSAAAVVMTVIGYGFCDPIMKLLCGSVTGTQSEMAKDYYLYYLPGGAMTLMAYIPLYFLKTEGKPKYSSRLFTLSAVMNVILSWLFMSPVFNMGISGASLATSISYSCVAVLGFVVLLRDGSELRLVKDSLKKERIREILVSGIPSGVSNLLESGRILLINMLLIYSGAAVMLTCYTVVRNVNDVLNSVIIGISSAVIPLIGVFYGERAYGDERVVMNRSLRLGVVVMAVLTVLVSLFAEPLFYLFGVTDPAMIAEGRLAIPLSCFGLVAAYVNTLYTSYLTVIQREDLATLMVALRLLILLALFAVPLAFTMGSTGIWLSLSLAEIATFGVFCLIRTYLRKKKPSLDRYLLDRNLEKRNDVTFSVRNNAGEIVKASEIIGKFCDDNNVDMRRSMKVSLALEEILTFLLEHCLGKEQENYVAVRVSPVNEEEVMIRFRYVGEIYDPMDYYQNNQNNEELAEELLGLKMVTKSASYMNFQQTLGANNLTLIF